jgi:hypothetical protein
MFKNLSWSRILYMAVMLTLVAVPVLADPLDDAGSKVGGFLTKAGGIATGLVPVAGGLAVAALAIKRAADKAMGAEEQMSRTSNQIVEVLKLTGIGMGASLLVAIAGSVLS